jgi:NaMN:DMB phosphoribosyltransferase
MSSNTTHLLRGVLSSTDNPEMRLRFNVRSGEYSVRIYARNRVKTGHGTGSTLSKAVEAAVEDRMRNGNGK